MMEVLPAFGQPQHINFILYSFFSPTSMDPFLSESSEKSFTWGSCEGGFCCLSDYSCSIFIELWSIWVQLVLACLKVVSVLVEVVSVLQFGPLSVVVLILVEVVSARVEVVSVLQFGPLSVVVLFLVEVVSA